LSGQVQVHSQKPVQPEQNTKLYRSYMSHARRYLRRHRGKSPHQVAYFARSLRRQQETALSASCRPS
jgi:hypothetical protein